MRTVILISSLIIADALRGQPLEASDSAMRMLLSVFIFAVFLDISKD